MTHESYPDYRSEMTFSQSIINHLEFPFIGWNKDKINGSNPVC